MKPKGEQASVNNLSVENRSKCANPNMGKAFLCEQPTMLR